MCSSEETASKDMVTKLEAQLADAQADYCKCVLPMKCLMPSLVSIIIPNIIICHQRAQRRRRLTHAIVPLDLFFVVTRLNAELVEVEKGFKRQLIAKDQEVGPSRPRQCSIDTHIRSVLILVPYTLLQTPRS